MTIKAALLGSALAGVVFSSNAAAQGAQKMDVCHMPPGNPENARTISIPDAALAAHLAHGDWVGSCAPTADRAGRPNHGGGNNRGGAGNNRGGGGNQTGGGNNRADVGRREGGNQPQADNRGGRDAQATNGESSRGGNGHGRNQQGRLPAQGRNSAVIR